MPKVSNEAGQPLVMPDTDSEPTSMEDPHALEDEEGSSTNIPSPAPPTTVPSLTTLEPTTSKAVSVASNDCSSALSSSAEAEASPAKPAATPPIPTTTRPDPFPSETTIETKAVSVASNDCSSALSSPAEASPAKPAATPPIPTTTRPDPFPIETTIETKAVSVASNDCSSALSSPAEASPAKPAATPPVETSPATSRIASASDSLTDTGLSLVSISEPPPPSSPVLPSTTYGKPGVVNNFPAVLIFKGVSVTLENNSVWKQFYGCGTEMILTKPGRRMFPYCRYRLSGLDPNRQYSLVLSIVPSDPYRYRWSSTKWEITGPAEHQGQGLIRAFSHHYSPGLGSEWMGTLVSFYKLKLTNHPQDLDGHIILNSMHRYIPRLHVIPVPDGDIATPAQPVVVGPESMTFTFPQTEFMAVTTYQNFRITQLKINHNPFAKGFREDGNNTRLIRVATEAPPVLLTDTRPPVSTPAEPNEKKEEEEEVVDLSTKTPAVSASLSNEQRTRLVLKPIMSTTSSTKDDPYVHCLRGKQALGELVLVQNHRPLVEPKEEPQAAVAIAPATSTPTPGSSPGYHKRRKRINRHWSNSRGRDWKAAAAAAPPTVFHSPSLTVAMQPELDDVEGLLFVSFTSKEALEVHVGDKPANSTPAASPISPLTPVQWKEKADMIPETDEEKIARLEATLLQDLQVLKHRQVIHPVLQEVGMKLSSLDPMKSIDLQYLRVHLPLPPPNLPEESKAGALSPADKEFTSFMSRTGKTSDMTKIKGWRNKFIRNKETSPSNCDVDGLKGLRPSSPKGSQKNLSAFCSNMLDEYLESEAQYISERAAAFSTNCEDSVAYRLPVKSSSYVKTLDSVLKHRKAASKFPLGANRPCPLSHKPLLYSALASPALPLASPKTPVQAGVRSTHPPASSQPPGSSHTRPAAQRSSCLFRLSAYLPGLGQRPAVSFGQSPAMTHRPSGLTKFQRRLMQMEHGAVNQGLSRTHLTTERLSVALAGLLTKQMLPSQVWKVTKYPTYKPTGPECGQEFCTLGCVCSSLQHLNRAPFHCRRPECMFGCACFKRKIIKQLSAGEKEELIQPVYSMTNMEHMVQPRPGSHANRLWNRSTHEVDPEPLFIPKTVPPCLAPGKKRTSGARLTQPIREEDKDPVYKYLESMMTCARVREFNSKPPPELSIEPKILDVSALITTAKQQKTTTDDLPKKPHSARLVTKAGRVSEGIAAGEKEAKKQIEIQSACKWVKDRKMVLEALCQRMNQNRLSRRFWVGPYRIHPVAKIFMKKPSGSFVTYRLRISKPSKASDTEEDEFDDSDEEKQPDKSFDGDMDAEEDDCPNGESDVRFGVTPFLSGVLPAGRLKARTKPVGCQAYGLIQVNGKSYNQARLLLGNMGSLHPANRLAAFITGRLHPPGGISLKVSRKSDPTNKIPTPDAPHIKAAGTVVPPVPTARKTADLKPPTQPPVQIFLPDVWMKGSIDDSTVDPFASGIRSSVRPFQNSSTSSPVSLTVSPALKTPSFLGQSGTYSFRICPPANQGTRDQNLPGITLPGGFTLIELPKHGADGAASEAVNTTNMPAVDKAQPQKDAVVNFGHSAADSDAKCLGLKTCAAAKDLPSSTSVQPGPSPELLCDVKIPSQENDETNSRQVESNPDIASEDLSSDSDSDSSDYCGEVDEDVNDEVVDIETVEEVRQGVAIAQMKEVVPTALKEPGDSSDGLGSTKELNVQDKTEDCKDNRRRKNHTVLERQRRCEQRTLFDKLQAVLTKDARAPRLHVLSMALDEIQKLVATSRCLEEKKRRLTRMQSLYVKELSLLSGKSNMLIKNKLKEICERQKVKEKTQWKPFFSNLLQSRAALLQSTAPPSQLPPRPLLMPDFFRAPSQAKPTTNAAQKQLMSLLQSNLKRALTQSSTQPPKPPSASSAARVEVPAPPPQGGQHQKKSEEQQEKPGAPAQVSVPIPQPECSAAATPLVTAAQDGASSSSTTPTSSTPPVKPAPSFSLPLIRAKNGRIILPSSLKPLGHGFYTLTVMEPRQTGQEDEVSSPANKKPFDVESLVKGDMGSSELDRLVDVGSNHILEKEKTVPASQSNPKRSGVATPVAELALLNKSILMPSVALQAAKSGEEGGTAVGLNKTPSTACLSFNRVKHVPASAKPAPRPPVVSRCRGRPRKPPVTPVGTSTKHTGVKDSSKRETSLLVEERQNEKLTSKVTKTRAGGSPGTAGDSPVPVKRGKGRPPKKKTAPLWSPPVAQAGSIPSNSTEDSPVRLSRSSKSPDSKPKEGPAKTPSLRNVNASRPLTRGALGKDFPSAKKRSWIDVEKELEPELESEAESESE
ncbi:MAX gene-associated protein isoform X2 [Anarrhichthys ocellatus]|uniref:MAX gene-associated protein isoform X2 n=1 Tax=Anarrhichthys ocellatus TaxID=433405 RepID=UPI0012ECCFED|nr:MAX gene-associated protein-like isoform X2 [Anarrhichthys ocellatus]